MSVVIRRRLLVVAAAVSLRERLVFELVFFFINPLPFRIMLILMLTLLLRRLDERWVVSQHDPNPTATNWTSQAKAQYSNAPAVRCPT
jgi:hypothetical protein